jgi:hypothetical protein
MAGLTPSTTPTVMQMAIQFLDHFIAGYTNVHQSDMRAIIQHALSISTKICDRQTILQLDLHR